MNNEISIKEFIKLKGLTDIRLHLGCGGRKLENYINIDLYPSDPNAHDSSRSGCVADLFCDIKQKVISQEEICGLSR